jgi:(p)ppGpp synthase/HD superfamily hydrolase
VSDLTSGGMQLIARADAFAEKAHTGQKRKYTGEDYIVHPRAVAEIVKTAAYWSSTMVAAALLHDVIEDCGVTREQLKDQFGFVIADLVFWLSNVSKPGDGNRAKRKAMDAAHLSQAPAAAQTIKVADLIHNTESIIAHDPDFTKVYLPEKMALLRVMTDADQRLWERAVLMIIQPEISDAVES